MEKVRKSNFELLRIIAMFMIIAHHFAVHSSFTFPSGFTTINRLWIQFIAIGGKIGVNTFVMMSGYFLVNSTKMKWSKVFKLWSQLAFYSVGIYFVLILKGMGTFSWNGLMTALFPIGYGKWWFPSAYIVLYLFSPYINRVLNAVNKREFQKFLLTMAVLWSVIPTFTDYSYGFSNLAWFVFIYCLGGYIKLHGLFDDKVNSKTWILLACICTFFTYAVSVGIDYIKIKSSSLVSYSGMFYEMNMIPILFISVFLFMGFAKMEIKYNKRINFVSATMFGVYLIHDEASYISDFLWNTVFKTASFSFSKWFIFYSIAVIGIVFVLCSVIELLRINLIEKNLMRCVNKVEEKLYHYLPKK